MIGAEGERLIQKALCQLELLARKRTAENLGPHDRGDPYRFAVPEPAAELLVFRRTGAQGPNQEARIQVDHVPRFSARRDDARRSERAVPAQARALAAVRWRDLCRASRASIAGFAAPGSSVA